MSLENYFGESSLKDYPRKGLGLVIKEGSVTSSKIRDGNVTTDKLADGAVDSKKIALGSIRNDNISNDTIGIEKFQEELRQIIKAASGVPDDLLKKMQDISNDIEELQGIAFPLTLSMSVTGDSKVENATVSYRLTCKGEEFIPDTLELRKNNTILTNAPVSSGSVTSKIETNTETFTLTASKEGQSSKQTSITKYLCYYGGNPSSEVASIGFLESLNRAYVSNVSFNPSVTVKDGEYIWLVLPDSLRIQGIKSNGFDVPFEESNNFVVPSVGTFRSYRTSNTLEASSWNLVIS